MAVDIHKLIAAVSPDTFCDPSKKSKVKKIAKEQGYLKAAKEAKIVDSEHMEFDFDDAKYNGGPFSLNGLKNPIEKHTLIYEANAQSLEQIYFWIHDFTNTVFGKTEKLIDNFVASPGSAYFGEMGTRSKVMQEEVTKMFGAVNQVIKSILNIIYDLKEFKQRLGIYKRYHSEEKSEKEAALLSLKQIWMDTVDIKRGAGSINSMAQQLDFVTLRDAFIAAPEPGKGGEPDLNDRVKRILKARVGEFYDWLKISEKELTKRYSIETSYLKSQVATVQLYSRWMKPYLNAAVALEQRARPDSSIVNAFNTALFELAILAEGRYNPEDDIDAGDLPSIFQKKLDKGEIRSSNSIMIIEFNYRTIPERMGQQPGYGFRGKAEVNFTSYALNSQELEVVRKELQKSDLEDAFKIMNGMAEDSLAALQEDLDEFLKDDEKEEKAKEEKKKSKSKDPISALFFPAKKKEPWDSSKPIPADNEMEKVIRSQAIFDAREKCRKVYDTYKKVHGMAAFD